MQYFTLKCRKATDGFAVTYWTHAAINMFCHSRVVNHLRAIKWNL